LSGQEQGWNMFTPGFPPSTVIPAVEFRFADGTSDRVHSRFEPGLSLYRFRLPLIDDREFNFEANIFMLAWEFGPETLNRPDLLQQLPGKVRDSEAVVRRWLQWQWKRYQASHPQRAEPGEVVLVLRYIPIARPGEPEIMPRAVFERPFARWRPGTSPEPGFLSVEAFDPVLQEFVPLKAWTP
jgi:hypothetical protein